MLWQSKSVAVLSGLLTAKGHNNTFCCDGNVLYVDCQNASKYTLKMSAFHCTLIASIRKDTEWEKESKGLSLNGRIIRDFYFLLYTYQYFSVL